MPDVAITWEHATLTDLLFDNFIIPIQDFADLLQYVCIREFASKPI